MSVSPNDGSEVIDALHASAAELPARGLVQLLQGVLERVERGLRELQVLRELIAEEQSAVEVERLVEHEVVAVTRERRGMPEVPERDLRALARRAGDLYRRAVDAVVQRRPLGACAPDLGGTNLIQHSAVRADRTNLERRIRQRVDAPRHPVVVIERHAVR